MKRAFGLLAVLLLSSCAPTIATPPYSVQGAASTGSFSASISGALERQLRGTAYTTIPGRPGLGVAISMGVNDGTQACVVSLAFNGFPQVASYTSFVKGTLPVGLSFSGALNCHGDRWTVVDRSGKLTITNAGERLAGKLNLPLTSPSSGTTVWVKGSFNLTNPY